MQESAATPSKPREGTYARPLDSPMPSLPSGRSTETTFAVPEEKSHPNESDLTAANTAIVQKIDLKNENSKSDTVPESTSGHLGHSGAIDPDLALAMQLQMQEEESFVKAEERIPPVTHGHSTERKSDQTKDGSNSHHVGNKESFVDGLTQEERDQQFSMMIHHEEMQQARLLEQQQELERYGRQGKSKSGQTKSSNCVIS